HVERPTGEPAQSHAWIEFHAPSMGWVPFDPTHNALPDERYVVVAHGRSYDDVPPNRGIYRGSAKEVLAAAVRPERARGRSAAQVRSVIDLGDLGGGASVATSINARGQVVATVVADDHLSSTAFVWWKGVMTLLPRLGGTQAIAVGINARGQIVGEVTTADGE